MSNTFINPTIVAKEALRQLENELVIAGKVYRDYEDEWKKQHNGYKIGSSVTIKAPIYFRVKDGATLDAVDLFEQDITMSVDQRKHVAWAVTSAEMTLNLDKFSERFIKPAMQALANKIDLDVLGLYKYIPNQVGTPGTTPQSFLTFAQAQARLSEEAAPQDNRFCVVDPQAQAYMADNLKALFHQQMVEKMITKGKFGNLAGFEMLMSQNVRTHTCGTWAGVGTITKNGASSDADETLAINGGGSGLTFTAGDIFTIAGVNAVNPITGEDTGQLRQFVVTTAGTMTDLGGGDYGDASIDVTPGTDPLFIRGPDSTETYLPYQTVSALPANAAAITIAGTAGLTHKVNLALHKDCLALAMVPLAMPASAVWKAQESYKGLTIRVIRDYTISSDTEYIRFDVLYGLKAINPRLGCRIAG